jgi:hypothetical protein
VRLGYIPLIVALVVASACSSDTSLTTTTPTPTTTQPSTFTITWTGPTFPSTAVGTTSSSTIVATLWNTGTSPVAVGSVTDSNVAEFPWVTTCALGGALPAASDCTVTTSFRPSSLGARAATLAINANSQTQTLTLGGTGVQAVSPQLSISPSSGSTSTPFVLSFTGATPSGQMILNTKYTPSPGGMDMSFAPTTWTADASGNLTVTMTHDNPGTFENWFTDSTTSLSSNHVTSIAQ